jgi:hypothetical protein
MKDSDIDEMTRVLSLALHAEVSDLVSATDYRSHRKDSVEPDPDKILFESVDVIRYAIAIMNLWGITPDKFTSAWKSKDRYLYISKMLEKNLWKGEKVAIVDMDDVICEFRKCFSHWLLENKKIKTNIDSKEYYFINALEGSGLNPEKTFFDFVSDDGFLKLEPVSGASEFMKSLRDRGYYIHILTARPGENLRCLYNTFEWLEKYNICFDKVSFSSEKLRWCMNSKYWVDKKIAFAVDDSPKHATEYAKHGVRVFSPVQSYNGELSSIDNCIMVDKLSQIIRKL